MLYVCETVYFFIFVLIVVDEISGRVVERIKYLFQAFVRYVGFKLFNFDELFVLFSLIYHLFPF